MYAAEGTAGHALAEHLIRKYLKKRTTRPTSDFYTDELVEAVDEYVAFVISEIEDARRACAKGNIPFAPHLLFPQFLNDGNLYDRETGMVMGLSMLTKCAEVWVFGDNHTPGMRREIKKAKLKHIPIRYFDTACREVSA